MTDQLETFGLKMLEDMIDATSSQVSGCGIMPSLSQDGVTHQSGQEAAPANRFLLPDDKKVKEMIATYGPNGSGSSASAALQKSLESKLRQQLPTGGLTMFIKGWNRKATPLGRLYYQLAASVRPIEGRDYGLWATPNTMDGMPSRSLEAMERQFSTTRKGRTAPANLREQVVPAMWPTPRVSDATGGPRTLNENGQRTSKSSDNKFGANLSDLAMWPTVTVTDANKRGNVSPRKNAMGLSETAALWPTVNASDHRDRGSFNDPCIQRRLQKGKQIGLTMIAQGTGKMESGSTALTESKGSLNPEFPCWLMGIPNEWVSSIVRGMQSLPKSRQNSLSQPCLEDMLT